MNRARLVPAVLISVALLLISGTVYATKESLREITIVRVDGYVDVRYGGSDEFVSVTPGDTIGPGDIIRTDEKGAAELLLADKSVVKVGPLSRVLVKDVATIEVTRVSKTTFELITGKIRAVVKPLLNRESSFTIKTNNATVGVRGTDFGVIYDPDRDATYVLGISGCVVVGGEGATPRDVCAGKEILLVRADIPAGPADASRQTIDRFLEEMTISNDGTYGPAQSSLPYIAGIFLNRSINLQDIDGPLTLTKDSLSIDGTIRLNGTAIDDTNRIASVMISVDGGMTWEKAAGTDTWSYSFIPITQTEYDIRVKAINEAGAQSDPREIAPILITVRNVDNDEVVREVVGAFIDGLQDGNVSGIRDIVSNQYDGSIGGYFSKDELIDEGIRDTISVLSSVTVSYTVDQVSVVSGRLVAVTSWTSSILGKTNSGKTKWWLSPEDNYALVHAEGDWLLAGINPNVIVLADGILMEEIDSGNTYPCHKAVRIYVTAPNVPAAITSILVGVSTYAPASWTDCTFTRSYYEAYTGLPVGFGGEVVLVYTNPPPTLSCSPIGFGDPPYDSISASYNDYGYSFYVTDWLVP